MIGYPHALNVHHTTKHTLRLTEKENPHPLNLEIGIENDSSGVNVLERLDCTVTFISWVSNKCGKAT